MKNVLITGGSRGIGRAMVEAFSSLGYSVAFTYKESYEAAREIEERFGKRVRELVEAETENKRADLPPAETWRLRKEESLAVLRETSDIAVLMVWLGDKLANMRSIYREFKAEGNKMWQKFNQKDEKEQAWYYRSIADLTARLSDTSAWQEYKALIELVFGKGE